MLQFYRKLYISPNIRHPAAIKRRLRRGDRNAALYVITLCDEALTAEGSSHSVSDCFSGPSDKENPQQPCAGEGQIQFFHSIFLQQDLIRQHCPMIIGIAEGRMEAIRIVQDIIEDTVQETGSPDVLSYLASHDARIRLKTPETAGGNLATESRSEETGCASDPDCQDLPGGAVE